MPSPRKAASLTLDDVLAEMPVTKRGRPCRACSLPDNIRAQLDEHLLAQDRPRWQLVEAMGRIGHDEITVGVVNNHHDTCLRGKGRR